MKEVGTNVRDARVERGLSYRELSRRSGVAISCIYTTETGKTEPTYRTLRKIAEALEVPLQRLVA